MNAITDPEKRVVTLRGELRQDEPMARHTSWRVGGPADRAYFPADLDDLTAFLRSLSVSEPVHIVGLGSNLLVRDAGVRGTVILMQWALRAIRVGRVENGHGEIYAEAGIASPKVARFAAMHGFRGAEFLAGIPGTVGGALAMNAGCFGGETWKIVARAVTIDRSGTLRERFPEDYEIDYRHVRLKDQGVGQPVPETGEPDSLSFTPDRPKEWFVAAIFRLPRGDRQSSRRIIKGLLQRRLSTQPLEKPNAGSVFRNPPNDYAARLIEACGLKGRVIGGAQISDKHANFIVNTGGASASDIEALIELAERSVREKFGIELEREVRIVGER
ncbi:MAG: UDP-N-acetylenolpyruvoylglucosamine reductase [Betaproteobacteria bacterium SG8_41]|nr:MAG: UDP-N-acetylenolpyruvoylglucosamine reductase [Betaproteobacteria bacterium SG8_41]